MYHKNYENKKFYVVFIVQGHWPEFGATLKFVKILKSAQNSTLHRNLHVYQKI